MRGLRQKHKVLSKSKSHWVKETNKNDSKMIKNDDKINFRRIH